MEETRRRATRRNLEAWCTEALRPQGLKPAAHHRLLIHKLEHVATGAIPRLMVFMPPGSAKSTYASDLFPAWFLAQGPDRSVIGASHTAELAEAFSRRVRSRVVENSKLLGFALTNEAVQLWGTTNRGQYRAVGVGGPITGFRGDIAVVDDPVKSRQDADSEAQRNRTWEWFQSDLMTRLRPGGRIVLVMTRWHEDDLAGRLLEREPSQWQVISLPALAEANDALGRRPGMPLWGDDAYGYAGDLAVKQATADGRTWSALYQQRPAPESGDYFRREWLRFVSEPPPRDSLRIFGGSDYAVTADGGDYTVHVIVGIDTDDRLWLLDVWRSQSASDRWVEAFCDLVILWKPMGWAEETGQIRAGVGPFLDKRQIERGAYVARDQFPTRGVKAVRAQSFRGRIALKGLHIAAGAPWRADLEAEMMAFPAGKHDDQVDALGLVGQLLDKMIAPSRPEVETKPRDSWARAFARGDEDEDGWKTT